MSEKLKPWNPADLVRNPDVESEISALGVAGWKYVNWLETQVYGAQPTPTSNAGDVAVWQEAGNEPKDGTLLLVRDNKNIALGQYVKCLDGQMRLNGKFAFKAFTHWALIPPYDATRTAEADLAKAHETIDKCTNTSLGQHNELEEAREVIAELVGALENLDENCSWPDMMQLREIKAHQKITDVALQSARVFMENNKENEDAE